MKIINTSDGGLLKDQIDDVINFLMSGDVIMHSTETCYGLSVDINQREALDKLYHLKGRDFHKPVSILVKDIDEALKYGLFNDLSIQLANKFWPGALTIVVPRGDKLPDYLNSKDDFIGIRCPDHKITQTLLTGLGGPTVTTSANMAGLDDVYSVESFLTQMKGVDRLPSIIIDSGTIKNNLPSTVIKLEGKKYSILRSGENVSEVENFMNKFFKGELY